MQSGKPFSQADKEFKVTSNSLVFSYPEKYDGKFALTNGGAGIIVHPEKAFAVAGELEGQSLVYRQAYPSTDVIHQVSDRGDKEFLNLRDSSAPASFGYNLTFSGPETSVALVDGRVEVQQFGKSVFQVAAPWLVDGSGQKWQGSNTVRWELASLTDGSYQLNLALNTAGLTFPLLVDPSWSTAIPMTGVGTDFAFTALGSGKALASGGNGNASLTSAAVFDSATNTWNATGSMKNARSVHTLTTLQDGTVLAAGGENLGVDTPAQMNVLTSEIYNPATGTWTNNTNKMKLARVEHTASLLANGKVLVAGGRTPSTAATTATSELYDPAAHSWAYTGSMSAARVGNLAVTLTGGKVLIVGSIVNNTTTTTAEIYNSPLNSWSAAGTLSLHRVNFALVAMADGRAMVIGGYGDAKNQNGENVKLDSTEIYDPGTNSWSAGPYLKTGRSAFSAVRLSDGKIMVAGGISESAYPPTLPETEIYDPGTNKFTNNSGFHIASSKFQSVLLTTGKVLGVNGANSELFDPTSATPAAPDLQSAAGSSLTLREVRWLDNSNNETGFSIERYDPFQSKFVQISTVGANVTSYDDDTTGLIGEALYRVRANNAAGYSGYSRTIFGYQDGPLTPEASGLVVTDAVLNNFFNTAKLTWTSNSVRNYIERKVGAGGTWQPLAITWQQPYFDKNLSQGNTYYYRVKASPDGPYTSVVSISDTIPPAAPSNVTYFRNPDTSFQVNWADNSTNEGHFVIYRKPVDAPSSEYYEWAWVDANITTYKNSVSDSFGEFVYRVRAVNINGYSAPSADGVLLQSAPPMPNAVASSKVLSSIAIQFNWLFNRAGQSDKAAGFVIERQDGSNVFTQTVTVVPTSAILTGINDIGLQPGTVYTYRVKAYNASGSSAYSDPITLTTPGIDFTVNSSADDSTADTLRSALTNATAGQSILITAPSITLSSDLPVPAANVAIIGDCTGGPQIHIHGSPGVQGLALTGGATLFGVQLEDFDPDIPPLKLTATASGRNAANTLKCVKVVKKPL